MFRKLFSMGKKKETGAKQLRQRLNRHRLGAERLEERLNFAALLAGLDVYGNLVVEDTLPNANTNNGVSIVRNGANVEVTSASTMLSGIGGTQVNGQTVSIPFASITGQIKVNTMGGNDSLTVDFTTGVPVPAAGLWYDGGAGTTDSLSVLGNFTNVTSTYTTASQTLTAQQGTLNLDGSVINYKAIEPLTIIGNAVNVTLNLPGKGDLAQLSGVGVGDLRVASTAVNPSFETTTFVAPTGSLTINLGADAGTFTALASSEGNLDSPLIINGQDGNDTISVAAYTTVGVTINGGNGNDTVQGGAGDDEISGDAGNDLLNGNDGDDSIDGGNDADTINGGNGFDLLVGGLAGDTITGGNDSDFLFGDEGSDVLNGNAGQDVVFGGNGADKIQVLGAEGQTDFMFGGNPFPVVDASTDDLVFLSDVTLDNFDAPSASIERIVGNNNDLLGTAVVNVFNLTGVQPIGLASIDGLAGNDTITGTAFNDVIIGNDGADSIDGGNGNDTITGGIGNDTILGGLGNDVITGGADVDNIDAGGGDDTINVNLNDSETDVIQGGANTDTIVNMTPGVAVTINGFNAATQGIERWSGGNADIQGNANANVLNFQISASTTVVFSGVTAVRGLAGNDTITGTNAADIIYGGDDNDVISGLGGDDQLFGDAGADSLNGGAGADQLFGGDGVDTLTGGAGIDTFVFEDSIVDVTETDVITDFSNDRFRYVGYGPATNYATLVVSVPGGGPDTLITDSVTGKTIRLANVVKTKPQLPSSLFTFV